MAYLFPTFENISRLKVEPTLGELALLKYLDNVYRDDNDVEIYFQPFLNGDMPDIVIMKKGVGVTIIEVKDWDLGSYRLDYHNQWHFKKREKTLKSPIAQVHHYRDNLYNLHINGLLEAKIHNPKFFGRIKTFVYFHKSTKKELNTFYNNALEYYKEKEASYIDNMKAGKIEPYQLNEQLDNITKIKKGSKIENDLDYEVVGNDNLSKISLPKDDEEKLFTDIIYREFQRYLQPPMHVLEQGKKISYTQQQQKLIESKPILEKIKGVAGSGKTAVLAKRAVNAHKKHGERVVILTYNITLINYIHDKISDVRENFRWDSFYIMNYHEFFKQQANSVGIYIDVPEFIQDQIKTLKSKELQDSALEEYLETTYYSNIDIFNNYTDKINKYKTILIDEVQDYRPEWIKLIRKHFLEENAEMVLFGDEKQNIYERELDEENKIKTVHGFGRWKYLKRPIRQQGEGTKIIDLSKKFQKAFFEGKYELDNYDNFTGFQSTSDNLFSYIEYSNYSEKNIKLIAQKIFHLMKQHHMHPNDTIILSSRINPLKELDFIMRNEFGVKTITTFETKEMQEFQNSQKYNSISEIRKIKKIHFRQNSGKYKLSTVHSYKGFESKAVILLIYKDEYYEDDAEIVYAGFTRCKSDLLIIGTSDSNFSSFFSTEMKADISKNKDSEIIDTLKNHIHNQICINLEYEQHNKYVKYNDVKPYKILFMQDNFYVACEVDNKYKFMMFRISKVNTITGTDTKFYYNPNIKEFIDNIQTPFSRYSENFKDSLIDIVVKVDKPKADFFKIKKFLPSQEIISEEENGDIILRFQVTQEIEIEDLIKRWIPYLHVLEPFSLDEKIKNDLRKYLE